MTYRVIYKDDKLEHGGLWDSAKKGLERAGHKYLKREWKNGRWHYVYKTSDERLKDEERQLRFNTKMQRHYGEKTLNNPFATAYYRERNKAKREKLDKKKKKKKPKNVKNAVSKGKEKVKKFFQKNWGKVDTSGADKIGKNTYVTHDVKLKRN